jgi:hypothetical protein
MNTKPKAPKKTFTDTNANSFSDKVLRWELLEAKLAPLLDSMPHAKPLHAELAQLIADAKSHEFDLKAAKANTRQAVADRKAMMKKGDGIRSRLNSALAFEHGATSALLAEFGIRPRKPGGRKKKASPPPTPAPTPNPTPQPEAQSGTPATAPATGSGAEGTAK